MGRAFIVELDGDVPGAAADLAVFDVMLPVAATGVEEQLDRFAAVRAEGVRGGVGYAVAEREAFIEPLVIILP